jgi:hypothetical protein
MGVVFGSMYLFFLFESIASGVANARKVREEAADGSPRGTQQEAKDDTWKRGREREGAGSNWSFRTSP